MSFTRHRARRTGFRHWFKSGEIKKPKPEPEPKPEPKPKPSDGGVAGTMLLVGCLFVIVLIRTCT